MTPEELDAIERSQLDRYAPSLSVEDALALVAELREARTQRDDNATVALLRSEDCDAALARCAAELERRIAGSTPWLLCEVNVRPLNAGSLRFHHRIGFTEVGQQDTDGGRKTVSLLAKPLS